MGWLLACGPEREIDPRPLVAVSVAPQAFVVERLAGERVRIEIIVPAGANPSTYEPSIRQLRALSEARLYVAVGHPAFLFETTWLAPMLAESNNVRVVKAASPDALAGGDPHVWVAPSQVDALAVLVAEELTLLLPDAKDAIAGNLAALSKEIAEVDALFRERIAASGGRRFVVLHPAWGHLAADYGLEQLAIEDEHKSPDAHELGELIETIRAAGTKVVFVQPQFDPTAAELVAAEIGAEVVVLDSTAREWDVNMRNVAVALAGGLVP
jgi:zinc transport system substrate-binding protein